MGRVWSPLALGLISSWLILALIRQAFDLIGRLWLPVSFDLLQILCCIIGLFAVCQRRKALLAAFAFTCLLSTAYNVLLGLWYEGVFQSSTHYAIPLSFGLPFSFSFFLKYTPGCSSHFDLHKSFWVQDDCFIGFKHLEVTQCVLHIILGISTMISIIFLLCSRHQQGEEKSKTYSAPTVSVESIPRATPSRVPPSLLDAGSIRSGYVNSSYDSREDVDVVRTSPNYRIPQKQETIQAFSNANYEDPVPEVPLSRQPVSQLQYSKRKSGSQNRKPEEPKGRIPTQNENITRQSGIFRKAREDRQTRHSRLPSECSPISYPNPSTAPGNPLHSLVSFNPKSSNFPTMQGRVPSDESDDGEGEDRESPSISEDPPLDEMPNNHQKPILTKPQMAALDAQYSKVQKRPKTKELRRPVSEAVASPESSSYRDAIGDDSKRASYFLRDQDLDSRDEKDQDELEEPAYERIAVYRRLGNPRPLPTKRLPPDMPPYPEGDYSPGNDGSSSDSGIHSGSMPIDWPPPPPPGTSKGLREPEERNSQALYLRSCKSNDPSRDLLNPFLPVMKGLRRVSTTADPPYPEDSGMAQTNCGSSLAEVIRQSIKKSSMMSLDDSNSSASINGIGSSMASVSGVSEGRKSRFQIERRNDSAIGHYHSAIEMKLVTPAGSITSGQRQTSMHRLSQVPGLTTALGLSNQKRNEANHGGPAKDYGISLMRDLVDSPGIRLRATTDNRKFGEQPMISDDSLIV